MEKYQKAFNTYLESYSVLKKQKSLYKPIQYILGLGGKRLRPVLTLFSADMFSSDYKQALDAALAVEVFHNFSLVHDDIMDQAPLRRGEPTVHKKWDINTGILSGDAMLIMAYQLFENYDVNTFSLLAKLFSKTALKVCEGQQLDIDFETQQQVSIPQYLKMVEYKTAVLLGAAMQMGTVVAKAPLNCQKAVYAFGKNLGIAFQLQDDYLDAFGDPKIFGKQLGGDIIENKKTYLFLKAMEFSNDKQRNKLITLFKNEKTEHPEKIKTVKAIFQETGAIKAIKQEIDAYTSKAFLVLKGINISADKKKILKQVGEQLMQRNM